VYSTYFFKTSHLTLSRLSITITIIILIQILSQSLPKTFVKNLIPNAQSFYKVTVYTPTHIILCVIEFDGDLLFTNYSSNKNIKKYFGIMDL
jgi:hypothetical protein